MNKTILDTIHSLFSDNKNEGRAFTFAEIFEKVESILGPEWKSNNLKSLSNEKIMENKMGETYKLLTVDGGFIRHEDGTWTKRKINETS